MKDSTYEDLCQELVAARKKFKGNKFQAMAVGEEFGELFQALLDVQYGKKKPYEVYVEAIQAAAMAIRIAEEGDADMKYRYNKKFHTKFRKRNGKK